MTADSEGESSKPIHVPDRAEGITQEWVDAQFARLSSQLAAVMAMDSPADAIVAAHRIEARAEVDRQAIRRAAGRAEAGRKWQNEMARFRFRAMQLLGNLLTQVIQHQGGMRRKTPAGCNRYTLSELGIDGTLSSRAQLIARMPTEAFDGYLASAGADHDLTLTGDGGILAAAKAALRETIRDTPPGVGADIDTAAEITSRGILLAGDCRDMLAAQPAESINLIMTSPPYADARPGGVPIEEYVGWWMARATQFQRVLTADGSLIVNIKERIVDGERSTYVLELIRAMRRAGWRWTEEYVWHKRNSYPGKWPDRFRDAWERLLHFTLNRDFAMYQDAVMVPTGEWAKSRLANLSEIDRIRDPSSSGSPFAKNVSNWLDRERAYPTNVLHLATECSYVGHSAAFPEELPEFFVKLFTRKGNLVCDPFAGSGTTGVVARRLGRHFIGIDILAENIRLAEARIAEQTARVAAD